MEENQENQVTVTMRDEDGNEQDFVMVDVVGIHGQNYALLAPAEGDEEEGLIILRLEGETLSPIEDEAEFEHVVAHLQGHAHQ